MYMRGEVFLGSASFLSFVATLLLVFVHVGQINTSTVPRGISMVKINTSQYGQALHKVLVDPIDGLYTFNATTPLQSGMGLRQVYMFGMYSYCGYVDGKNGICSNRTVTGQYRPYDELTLDMRQNYTTITAAIVSNTTFHSSGYLGSSSKAAVITILLGTICAGLALIIGISKTHLTFFVSTSLSVISSLLLLIGASIWTVIIKKSEALNNFVFGTNQSPVPLGIVVSVGSGLYLTWAAFACMLISIVPYMVSCCTFR